MNKSTIEDPSEFMGRLLSYYDSLFPRNGETSRIDFAKFTNNHATEQKIEVLLSSHSGTIRHWLKGLVEFRELQIGANVSQRFSSGEELRKALLDLTVMNGFILPNGSLTRIEVESCEELSGTHLQTCLRLQLI